MIKAAPGSERLKSFVVRIEKLEEEHKAIGGDKRDVYTELKAAGYNPKAVRKIIQQRRAKADPELDADVDTYRHALGMAVDMVSNGEVSLRKAAKATGVSKSSIHRALAVPEVSQPAPPAIPLPSSAPVAASEGDLGVAAAGGRFTAQPTESSSNGKEGHDENHRPSREVLPGNVIAGAVNDRTNKPSEEIRTCDSVNDRPDIAQEGRPANLLPRLPSDDLTIPKFLRRTA